MPTVFTFLKQILKSVLEFIWKIFLNENSKIDKSPNEVL